MARGRPTESSRRLPVTAQTGYAAGGERRPVVLVRSSADPGRVGQRAIACGAAHADAGDSIATAGALRARPSVFVRCGWGAVACHPSERRCGQQVQTAAPCSAPAETVWPNGCGQQRSVAAARGPRGAACIGQAPDTLATLRIQVPTRISASNRRLWFISFRCPARLPPHATLYHISLIVQTPKCGQGPTLMRRALPQPLWSVWEPRGWAGLAHRHLPGP
jgi:hypothetical protein